jgi:small subunit ribosomal protein S20
MPITKSAVKAMRSSLRKKASNDQRKKMMKEVIKKIEKTAKEDKKEAEKILPEAFSIIDKTCKKGIIKKNNASRKKARLYRLTKPE